MTPDFLIAIPLGHGWGNFLLRVLVNPMTWPCLLIFVPRVYMQLNASQYSLFVLYHKQRRYKVLFSLTNVAMCYYINKS
jgi:hypothetical protein